MLFTVHFSLVGNDLSYLNPKINTFLWLQPTIDMCGIIKKEYHSIHNKTIVLLNRNILWE
jgi:hypothetical protein